MLVLTLSHSLIDMNQWTAQLLGAAHYPRRAEGIAIAPLIGRLPPPKLVSTGR